MVRQDRQQRQSWNHQETKTNLYHLFFFFRKKKIRTNRNEFGWISDALNIKIFLSLNKWNNFRNTWKGIPAYDFAIHSQMIDNHDLILVQNRVKGSQYLMILEVKNYMCSTLPSVLSVNLVQRFFFRQIKITSKVA